MTTTSAMKPIADAPTSDTRAALPDDVDRAVLVGRAWLPGDGGGPCIVAVHDGQAIDLTRDFPTMAALLDVDDPAQVVRSRIAAGGRGRAFGSVDDLLSNSPASSRDAKRPWLLAPCDLQVIKACGVTFAASLVERVIEERAGGDPARADTLRRTVQQAVGDNLGAIEPGSASALALKDVLQAQGLWSAYLEVGIGPDAEVFTKAPVLAVVGTGADIGVRPDSSWNNPEPEVVMAVGSHGRIVGATLGNDVNLRDIEGRSALLLGKAKDNNASCAIGPFIRLFDAHYGMDDVRRETVHLHVTGPDGYVLDGINSMDRISRDPADLVAQTMSSHQYPDGFMLFTGTLFAPIDDRDQAGGGFTHKVGDLVSIRSARLGELRNRVVLCDDAPPWEFGLRAFFENLARRGLLGAGSALGR